MERRTVTFTIGGKPTEFQIINVHPDGTEFDPTTRLSGMPERAAIGG